MTPRKEGVVTSAFHDISTLQEILDTTQLGFTKGECAFISMVRLSLEAVSGKATGICSQVSIRSSQGFWWFQWSHNSMHTIEGRGFCSSSSSSSSPSCLIHHYGPLCRSRDHHHMMIPKRGHRAKVTSCWRHNAAKCSGRCAWPLQMQTATHKESERSQMIGYCRTWAGSTVHLLELLFFQ